MNLSALTMVAERENVAAGGGVKSFAQLLIFNVEHFGTLLVLWSAM